MTEETKHLAETLAFTAAVIARSSPEDRAHIAIAYREARTLAADIPKDAGGDAYPRIVACLRQFEIRKAASDLACAGWMLTAIQERVNERNLAGWRHLRKAVDHAVAMLPQATPTLH